MSDRDIKPEITDERGFSGSLAEFATRGVKPRLVERVKIEVEVDVDVAHLAEQFAALTDDAQAQFLCFATARLGKAADMQAFHIGRHLRDCECSTEAAREFVREVHRAMEEAP